MGHGPPTLTSLKVHQSPRAEGERWTVFKLLLMGVARSVTKYVWGRERKGPKREVGGEAEGGRQAEQ